MPLNFYHTDDLFSPYKIHNLFGYPHPARLLFNYRRLFPKGSERRAAATRSGPRAPAHDQAVRPHEGAVHPSRGGEDQAVSTENGSARGRAEGGTGHRDPSIPSLYASGVALSQPTRTPLPIIVAANA